MRRQGLVGRDFSAERPGQRWCGDFKADDVEHRLAGHREPVERCQRRGGVDAEAAAGEAGERGEIGCPAKVPGVSTSRHRSTLATTSASGSSTRTVTVGAFGLHVASGEPDRTAVGDVDGR